MHADLKTN